MSEKQDIEPVNEKGLRYGYWEIYGGGDNLLYKANYINNELIGYTEDFYNGELYAKEFYLR